MGSLFKTKVPAPPPPPPPVYIRDELNKVEQVPVKNADGSTTYVTRAIPLSAEEQANKDKLDSIMKKALSEIEQLSATDYVESDDTKKVLAAWEAERTKMLDESFSERRRAEDKELARRGLGDSTAGRNVRRRRRLDRQEADSSISRERNLLSGNIRQEKIGLQQNLYGIAANQGNAALAGQQQSAARGQSAVISTNIARRASVTDYYNRQLSRSQSSSPFSLFAKAALVGAGTYLLGPAAGAGSGGAGSSLGSGLFI